MTDQTHDLLDVPRHLKRRSYRPGDLLVAVLAVLAVGVPLALVVVGLLTQDGSA